jgi:predicted RNase H-like HicB family nuclease
MTFLVVYERTPTGYAAFVPDLPGYAATAPTVDELRSLVREGIPFHVEGLRASGLTIPEPAAVADTVDVA